MRPKFVTSCEDLPANHANSRESQEECCQNILIWAVMKPPLLALSTLAFIRVIRGLNVFGYARHEIA
jgi:hypothetical protein